MQAAGYGSYVSTKDPAFVAAFRTSQWVDLEIVAPDGRLLRRVRVDLNGLPEALARLEMLTEKASADTANPKLNCSELHIEV
jgi:hypothetical protein